LAFGLKSLLFTIIGKWAFHKERLEIPSIAYDYGSSKQEEKLRLQVKRRPCSKIVIMSSDILRVF
jgi:hypothetical protein